MRRKKDRLPLPPDMDCEFFQALDRRFHRERQEWGRQQQAEKLRPPPLDLDYGALKARLKGRHLHLVPSLEE
jgi:hypothetical protein